MVSDQLHERSGPGVKVDRRIGALRALGEGEEQTNLAPWPLHTNVTKARSSSLAVNSCSRILRDSDHLAQDGPHPGPRSGTW
jgi:hypothetical protein